jgi:signal transduction histidine kinase
MATHPAVRMSSTAPRPAKGDLRTDAEPRLPRETVSGAVWRTFRRAPLSAKLYLAGVLVYFLGFCIYIALTRKSALEQAPIYTVAFVGMSGLLLILTVALFRVAQGDKWLRRFSWGVEPKRLHEMLLAVPVLAFTAGAFGAAAAAVVLPRAAAEPRLLVGIAIMLFLTVKSGKVLFDASRWLYFHAREQASAAERARAEAADAQLAALQAQVNPHFLFNALNTIAALVRTDPRAAEATTENLARVLRRTLDRTRRTDCTVEDEVDFLRAWLSVERERFGQRLRVDFEVEPAAEHLRIPTMTLQPLVENSLKHGIAGKLEGGRVTVRVRRNGDRLRLEVEDDGAGFAREPREGTGLTNLRHRLETIYGGAAELRVERPLHGARVTVELPSSAEGDTGE